MLQRIQTIYLLIASISMLLASILPLARFALPNGDILTFEAMGVYLNGAITDSTWALMAVGAITTLIALLTIFLYKARVLQIRLTILNALLMVGFYLYAGFLYFRVVTSPQFAQHESMLSGGISFAVVFPFVAIVVSVLAIRRIYADEALVRSLSRLR